MTMYLNKSGYAEVFDISYSVMKGEELKAAAIQLRLEHLKALSLPFANSPVLNCSIATGGSWEEHHPPICPEELKAQMDDLEAYKAAERYKIMQPKKIQGEVIALKF